MLIPEKPLAGMNSMSGKFFLDTNIIVYTFSTQTEKQQKARELLETALNQQTGCISTQVIQEFINVATRKFEKPLTIKDCVIYLDEILTPLCEIFPDIALYEKALNITERWQFGFYDALIIAAAIEAKCDTLYSEDLQHQQTIESIQVINPFV